MNRAFQFFKEWILPIAMVVGAASYFIYAAIPWPMAVRHFATEAVAVIQPSLLFLTLLLLPSIFPSIRIFSNKSVLCIRWTKYWSFSFSICLFNEYSRLISFRMD